MSDCQEKVRLRGADVTSFCIRDCRLRGPATAAAYRAQVFMEPTTGRGILDARGHLVPISGVGNDKISNAWNILSVRKFGSLILGVNIGGVPPGMYNGRGRRWPTRVIDCSFSLVLGKFIMRLCCFRVAAMG